MHTAIIIPARYGSTRLPGKPLELIAGKTMLQRVYEVALEARSQVDFEVGILIATEDQRIVDHARELGATAVLTSKSCQTGTDRALEAIQHLPQKPDFVINLQGDAPLTPPDFIASVIHEFSNDVNLQVVTPVTQMTWDELDMLRENKITTPFSGTTAILNKYNDAIWFSKNIIPAIRKEKDLRQQTQKSPVYRHIGIYGYRRDVLEDYVTLEQSTYENLEGLEQLRLIENGYQIRAVCVDYKGRPSMSGIDSPEDIQRAETLLKKIEVA